MERRIAHDLVMLWKILLLNSNSNLMYILVIGELYVGRVTSDLRTRWYDLIVVPGTWYYHIKETRHSVKDSVLSIPVSFG